LETQYFTVSSLAKRLDISIATIYKWVREGKIEYVRLPSGDIRFDPLAIEQWLECRSSKKGESIASD
jgi:excisionase family DNA binding protein